jgi:NAD(P)-dependent dehydrogenase (short-subunit alcohol dehydrogenase family)
MKLPFNVDLSNEVVAITGAGGVLMSEFAKALAACGAKVGIIDLQEESCKRVADEIKKDGGKAVAAPANCLDKQAIIKAKEVIEKAFGKVTLLVNGAGGNNAKATTDNETMTKDVKEGVKTFFDLDQSGFQFVFDLNILTAILCSQVFAEDMVKAGRGNIINISSMNAYRPLTKIPAYSAAKAGVSNLTQWLAVHFAPSGIRCNARAKFLQARP